MSKFIITLLFSLCHYVIQAQKYDYHWILGDYPDNFDVVFSGDSADSINTFLKQHALGANMEISSTTVSDTNGDALLFYTNGAAIFNRDDTILMNGDSINYGWEWDNEGGGSYDWVADIIALPTDSPNLWNLFHYFVNYNPNLYPPLYPWRLYQTRIDMNGDSGIGDVLYKNKTIIQDSIYGCLSACKHANGRDWWILEGITFTNCMHTLLVQPDTIINYGEQCLGANFVKGDAGQTVFSPDGTKFAWVGSFGGINIFDFDRCAGKLSNAVYISYASDSIVQYGVSFSPNSRFLYVAQTTYIFQFDTWSDSIAGSADTVGTITAPPDSGLIGYYFTMQLAPNGKIYIDATNGIKYFHVINNPDAKGDSCNLVNYGFETPYYDQSSLPNYPNYRLGPLVGSPCDTIYKTDTMGVNIFSLKENILKIFPNPATDYTIIDYGFTDWSKGETSLQVMNELGQTVWQQKLPMYSGFQHLDISKYASGMYEALIRRGGSIVAEGKFVKQ